MYLSFLNISEIGLIEFPENLGYMSNLNGLGAWNNNLNDDSFPLSMNNLELSSISLDGNHLTYFPDFIQYSSNVHDRFLDNYKDLEPRLLYSLTTVNNIPLTVSFIYSVYIQCH